MSRVDALEWQVWAGVEQDDAERAMLADRAPGWVFLPPGGELATALEGVRPQAESPIALIEVMKAAARLVAWGEAVKMSAMASFGRQRQAQAADIPRPSELDARGRPTDPERSRAAEVACEPRRPQFWSRGTNKGPPPTAAAAPVGARCMNRITRCRNPHYRHAEVRRVGPPRYRQRGLRSTTGT
jgi:hypothetical protein